MPIKNGDTGILLSINREKSVGLFGVRGTFSPTASVLVSPMAAFSSGKKPNTDTYMYMSNLFLPESLKEPIKYRFIPVYGSQDTDRFYRLKVRFYVPWPGRQSSDWNYTLIMVKHICLLLQAGQWNRWMLGGVNQCCLFAFVSLFAFVLFTCLCVCLFFKVFYFWLQMKKNVVPALVRSVLRINQPTFVYRKALFDGDSHE